MKERLEIRIRVNELPSVPLDHALALKLWDRTPHHSLWPFPDLDTAIDRILRDNEFTMSQWYFSADSNEFVFRFL